ncbi:hypothetical protein Anapl_14760 [Anas platyrhynchos]|uniref:Uncharacterized protein n=1 Tax=Anas platyrhynchos TaxID=8839 RepID=R0L359_ANAPL|nr:hypothetical protein Anapl_14760 [Anas platyrhynchos]
MSTRRSSTESCSELQKKTGGSSTKGNVALEKSCLLHNPLCTGEEGTEGTQEMQLKVAWAVWKAASSSSLQPGVELGTAAAAQYNSSISQHSLQQGCGRSGTTSGTAPGEHSAHAAPRPQAAVPLSGTCVNSSEMSLIKAVIFQCRSHEITAPLDLKPSPDLMAEYTITGEHLAHSNSTKIHRNFLYPQSTTWMAGTQLQLLPSTDLFLLCLLLVNAERAPEESTPLSEANSELTGSHQQQRGCSGHSINQFSASFPGRKRKIQQQFSVVWSTIKAHCSDIPGVNAQGKEPPYLGEASQSRGISGRHCGSSTSVCSVHPFSEVLAYSGLRLDFQSSQVVAKFLHGQIPPLTLSPQMRQSLLALSIIYYFLQPSGLNCPKTFCSLLPSMKAKYSSTISSVPIVTRREHYDTSDTGESGGDFASLVSARRGGSSSWQRGEARRGEELLRSMAAGEEEKAPEAQEDEPLGLWTPGDALPGAPEQALAGVPRGHLPGAQWGDALIHGCRPASPRVRAVPPLGHQLGWLRADVAGGRGLRPRALPGELPAAARAFPQALAWHLEPTGLCHPQRAARWLSPPPAALPAQPPHHGPYLLALSSCGALLSSSFQPRACTSEALKGKESSDSSARISGGRGLWQLSPSPGKEILEALDKLRASASGPGHVPDGAAVLFAALLRLPQEGGHRRLLAEALLAPLPPALQLPAGLHLAVLWGLQVRAALAWAAAPSACALQAESPVWHAWSLASLNSSVLTQLLLLGAPPAAERGDAAGGAHHVHHLHGGGGGQPLLHHHGVPLLQARLVPPRLHPVACSLLTAQAVQCQPYGLPDTGLAPLPLCFSDTDPAGEGLAPTAVQTAGAHQNSPGRRGPVSAVSHAGSFVTRPHLTNTSVQPVLSHTEQKSLKNMKCQYRGERTDTAPSQGIPRPYAPSAPTQLTQDHRARRCLQQAASSSSSPSQKAGPQAAAAQTPSSQQPPAAQTPSSPPAPHSASAPISCEGSALSLHRIHNKYRCFTKGQLGDVGAGGGSRSPRCPEGSGGTGSTSALLILGSGRVLIRMGESTQAEIPAVPVGMNKDKPSVADGTLW